jgi:FkbM family methyltransferase
MKSFSGVFKLINPNPLAKKHLFAAYFEFLKWQIKSNLSKKIHIVKWIGGLKVYAKNGLTGITGNFYTGLHEFSDMGFLLHFLKPGEVFFDVGANVGSYTLLAAGIKKARCFAFEPVPLTFNLLNENIILNKLNERVTCIQAAVGATAGHIFFTQDRDVMNHVVSAESPYTNKTKVTVVKLDDYSAEQPILLKVDVEGYETEVLKGAQSILKHDSLIAIIIELNGSGNKYSYSEDAIDEQLRELGFEPYTYDPFARNLTALNHFGDANTIYIRNIEQTTKRVKSADPFLIFGESI